MISIGDFNTKINSKTRRMYLMNQIKITPLIFMKIQPSSEIQSNIPLFPACVYHSTEQLPVGHDSPPAKDKHRWNLTSGAQPGPNVSFRLHPVDCGIRNPRIAIGNRWPPDMACRQFSFLLTLNDTVWVSA